MLFIRVDREGLDLGADYRRSRSSIAAALLVITASLIGICAAYAGDLDNVIAFNIEAQTLDKALLEFGAQAHVQIMFAWHSSTARLRTQKLKGNYTSRKALTELLKGTHLNYVEHGRTLEIVQAPANPKAVSDPSPWARASKSLGPGGNSDPQKSSAPTPQNLGPSDTDRPSLNRGSSDSLGEIIVTAQKYRQSAFDVPISLDVVTGREIQEQQISSVTDLQYDVPGLVVEGGQDAHRVYLQGVGNSYGNGSLVGEYIDEADVTALASNGQTGVGSTEASLYDMRRVEVLRGPQGTLYGDGSMGGVIRYVTNQPDLDQSQMNADVAAGFTQYGAPSQRINAMLNTPLVSGAFGMRFAGLFENDGGWIDQPAAGMKNINNSNLVDVRSEALWQPLAALTVKAMEIIHRNSFGIGYDEDANGNIHQVFGLTTPPHSVVNFTLSNITTSYDFDWAHLLNSATYFKTTQNEYNLYDISTTSAAFGSATSWDLTAFLGTTNENYSDEMRLSDAGQSAWKWTIGGAYKHFSDEYSSQGYFGSPGPLSSATSIPYSQGDLSSSWAGFANTSYEVLNRLTLGAGIRYFKDRETTVSLGVPIQEANFTSTDPRFYLQYQISPHINSYASAAKGFRSGGFNVPGEPPYGPESLWSYTIGTKLKYLEDRLRSNVALFYSDYSNYVVVGYFPPLFEYANAGTARIEGVDADVAWRVNTQWQLSINAELLNTKFLTINGGVYSGLAVGDRLPFAPTYSFTASVERDFRWGRMPGYAELYYYEISRTQFRAYGFDLGESEIPHLLNFRAGVQWSDNLRLGVLATNLINDRGSSSPLAAITGESMRPQPRTLWIQFGVTFGRNSL